MRTILAASVALSCLAGCSTQEPLVDRINVSDAQYNRDLAGCREQTKGSWLPFTGGSVGDCLKGKGYRVLMGTTGL